MNFKKRDRRLSLSQDLTPIRSFLRHEPKQHPRKDPAVHVSLPSDAIVKQHALSGQSLPANNQLTPGRPRQNPNLEP